MNDVLMITIYFHLSIILNAYKQLNISKDFVARSN